MICAVGIAVHENLAARDGAAADHLVDEGPGKERRLVGIRARRRHALHLVLGILLVRPEQVIRVRADHDFPLRPMLLILDPVCLEHAEHRRKHIAPQGAGRHPGDDEVLIPEGVHAPFQKAEDHADRLSGADRPVRQHDPVVLVPRAGAPPEERLPLFAAHRLQLKAHGSSNSSCISSSGRFTTWVNARMAASASARSSRPALGRKRLNC